MAKDTRIIAYSTFKHSTNSIYASVGHLELNAHSGQSVSSMSGSYNASNH